MDLGTAAGLMIILGYPGELIIDGDLNIRWMWWTAAMIPFLYIVQQLLVGLAEPNKESDPNVKNLLNMACLATVISWCTYPIVYILPMFGLNGADAVVGIQIGYCISDIVSKCGVGFLIYNITIAKSAQRPQRLSRLGREVAPRSATPLGSGGIARYLLKLADSMLGEHVVLVRRAPRHLEKVPMA